MPEISSCLSKSFRAFGKRYKQIPHPINQLYAARAAAGPFLFAGGKKEAKNAFRRAGVRTVAPFCRLERSARHPLKACCTPRDGSAGGTRRTSCQLYYSRWFGYSQKARLAPGFLIRYGHFESHTKQSFYSKATASTSSRTPLGSFATSTHERAGWGSLKNPL